MMQTIQQQTEDLAAQIGVDSKVLAGAAEGCADRLVGWFGNESDAADAIKNEPQDMVGIALADYIWAQRKLTTQSLTSAEFSRAIYSMIAAES